MFVRLVTVVLAATLAVAAVPAFADIPPPDRQREAPLPAPRPDPAPAPTPQPQPPPPQKEATAALVAIGFAAVFAVFWAAWLWVSLRSRGRSA